MDTAFGTVAWDEAVRSFILHVKATCAPKTARFYNSRLRAIMAWAEEQGISLGAFGKRSLDALLAQRLEGGISASNLHYDALAAKAFLKRGSVRTRWTGTRWRLQGVVGLFRFRDAVPAPHQMCLRVALRT